MASPTTVLEFATQQNTALLAAQQTAQAALIGSQAAQTVAQSTLVAAQAQSAKVAADMTSIRNQLTTVATPEDGAALLASLSQDVSTSRQITGQIANAQQDLAFAKAKASVAASEVQRISTAVTASNAALANAQTQDRQRSAMKAAMAAPPLATIAADAATVAGGPTFTAAAARLAADLPPALQTASEQRLQDETDRVAALTAEALEDQKAAEAQWTSDNGVAGAVAALQSAFQRTSSAFTLFVSTASTSLTQVTATLANVADPTYSAMTPAQKAAVLNDSTSVVTNAKAATVQQDAVDAAVLDVEEKQAALDEAIQTALDANVDVDLTTVSAVTTAEGDLTTAQGTLATAQAAYTAVLEAQTTAWEVLVPDSEWQLLMAFENAKATLAWLQGPPTAAALDADELSLTNALIAADKSVRATAVLNVDATTSAAIAQYESTATAARQLSALRGDF